MVTNIWVNIGSGNGVLPDGTKPLPGSVLTCDQTSKFLWHSSASVTCINHKKIWRYQFSKTSEHCIFKIASRSPREVWVNSLWLTDAIWWHRSGSTLAQVINCCLMAWWLPEPMLTNWHQWGPVSQWPSPEVDFTRDTGLILSLRPANERRRYLVTTSLIGWAQT